MAFPLLATLQQGASGATIHHKSFPQPRHRQSESRGCSENPGDILSAATLGRRGDLEQLSAQPESQFHFKHLLEYCSQVSDYYSLFMSVIYQPKTPRLSHFVGSTGRSNAHMLEHLPATDLTLSDPPGYLPLWPWAPARRPSYFRGGETPKRRVCPCQPPKPASPPQPIPYGGDSRLRLS